ncbi:hypothetical protein AJ78_01123 [Emergomyces pasteurianus Ep9510]|uniref:Uncharacterized protein n=1 Tax=Emergomyces pasteurianus Ep9510 TaxID=1447872 RepID=A0A1J9QSM4_9EURO|nr:hypothetical protein AJ78_01123 [Emergomyces pasteurianus Ep9510]
MVPPSVKFIHCLDNWSALTLHRHLPVQITTSTGRAPKPQIIYATISTSSDETTISKSSTKSSGPRPAAPIAPTRSHTPASVPSESHEKSPSEKKIEAAKISSIIIGTIIFIAVVILGLLLGRSKWNKTTSQTSLRKLHEAEGSNGHGLTPTRRRTPKHSSKRTYTSREGFISFDDLSHSGGYSPAQELPTVVEERCQQMSDVSSPISPCVSSPR